VDPRTCQWGIGRCRVGARQIAVISDLSGQLSLAEPLQQGGVHLIGTSSWGQWRQPPAQPRCGGRGWRWKSPRRPTALDQGSRMPAEQQQGLSSGPVHRAAGRGDVETVAEEHRRPGSSDAARDRSHHGVRRVGADRYRPGSRCGGSSPVARRFSKQQTAPAPGMRSRRRRRAACEWRPPKAAVSLFSSLNRSGLH